MDRTKVNKIKYYEIHAFANDTFAGNPAGVCPLDQWLPDDAMQSIASSNNLSETAFFVKEKDGYNIRYFTPNKEVALCGHATLASAWLLFKQQDYPDDKIIFYSRGGILSISTLPETDALQMSLPLLPHDPIALDPDLLAAFNYAPQETYLSTYDLLFVYPHRSQVEQITIELTALKQFPYRGIILTAPAERTDIYSRCFFPGCTVFEDPVTGSAHAVLTPYWCKKLNKQSIRAEQGFHRRGQLVCELQADRILIQGQCRLFLEGSIYSS